jgi:WD40 repeat protein
MFLAIADTRTYDIHLMLAETFEPVGLLQGHVGKVTGIGFSHDGNLLATASEDHTIRIWNTLTKEVVRTLEITAGLLSIRSISSNNERLLTTTSDFVTGVWDLATGAMVLSLPSKSFGPGHVAPKEWTVKSYFSTDDNYVVTNTCTRDDISTYDVVKLLDARTGTEVNSFHGHATIVTSVAVCPVWDYIASGSVDGLVIIWELTSLDEKLRLSAHESSVTSIRFCYDGSKLASCSQESDMLLLRIWSIACGEMMTELRLGDIGWYCFNDSGSRLICEVYPSRTTMETDSVIFDLETGTILKKFDHFGMGTYSPTMHVLL